MENLKLGQKVFSTNHNKIMRVECVRFLNLGIVWLQDSYKTYPHTKNDIKLNNLK